MRTRRFIVALATLLISGLIPGAAMAQDGIAERLRALSRGLT